MDKIIVKGARENNLKNVDIEVPKNKLTVMTGVSGSGKSSLAFDTIYAEGQRRYVESLSSYARQFLGGTSKPDVDSIEGLSPSISIDQKTTNNNPRSTVGTVTEIYDYFRLLFARIGVPYCPNHNIPISSQSIEEMTRQIMNEEDGTKLIILSPVIYGEKGTHKELLDNLRKDGYVRVKIDGENKDLSEDISLEKSKRHNILVVIDRIVKKIEARSRIYEALELACKLSKGKAVVEIPGKDEIVMSESFACPHCDFSLEELEPRMFSFNAPYGSCPDCKGLGFKQKMSRDLIIPDKEKTLRRGGIEPYAGMDEYNIYIKKLEIVCDKYNIDMDKKMKDFTKKELDIILNGTKEPIEFKFSTRSGNNMNSYEPFEGVLNNLERRYFETNSEFIREWLGKYMVELTCPTCHGKRLKQSVLSVLINKKNIIDLTDMNIDKLYNFFDTLKLSKEKEEKG